MQRHDAKIASKSFKFFPSQGKGIYCSNKCQQEDYYKQNITDWLSKKITGKQRDGRPSDFVRRYLLEESGHYKCSLVWMGKTKSNKWDCLSWKLIILMVQEKMDIKKILRVLLTESLSNPYNTKVNKQNNDTD
jgi:hypothetical protein